MGDESVLDSFDLLEELALCGFLITRPDGTITWINRTLLDWTGHRREDLVAGYRFQDLLTVPGKIFYENQYAPLLRMQGFVKEIAFDLKRPDREPLPVLVSSVQQSDAEARPVAVASVLFDATDRRTYEKELLRARKDAERLAAVVTVASDAIVSASTAGIVQTWNASAERLFGVSAEAMIGRSLFDVLPLGDDEAARERQLSELRSGRAVHLETIGRHADGRAIDVSVGLTPHRDLLGSVDAVWAIVRDIGERRALERLQQQFLAMAAHELRNPVAGIKANAQLMRRRGSYNEQSAEAIIVQTNKLARLVDDLLLASQIEAAQFDIWPEATDLVEEVRAAVAQFGLGEHTIRIDAPGQPFPVAADRQRLGQVLANLLTNAVKYSPAGSEIVVRIARSANEARVAVVDQGIGIPPEALPHLFDRFYRAPGANDRAPGLGLGLYISGQIVEAHGGRIEVASVPGRGSTFVVVLPLLGSATGQ